MYTDRASSRFEDRREAGRYLAERLTSYAHRTDVLVLALPRGGVPVAFEVAQRLGVPLDLFLVRKLRMPGHEDLAIGAVASGGVCVMNEKLVRLLNLASRTIVAIKDRETSELRRRERAFRGKTPPPIVAGRTVIVIDDGLATGATMKAAVEALRVHHPSRIIVAAPVGSREACEVIHSLVDEAIWGMTPVPFYGVGAWYDDFSKTSDDEVHSLLAEARMRVRNSKTPARALGGAAKTASWL